ncbi:MAG: hypothetical protein HOW73_22460 [Polyangiaceae bacterium]|nr:hypothetical protein [Polyangiaceae bacterium]
MTASHLAALSELVAAEQWKDATAITRGALLDTKFDKQCVEELDAMWSSSSKGRFGFSAQIRAASRPAPRAGVPEEDWSYAIHIGKTVGWHDGRFWRRWPECGAPTLPGKVVAPEGPPEAFPRGCFPFHDSVSDASWRTEFSPRDCWGESVWTRWCDVWRAVGGL